jgi:uncharacterized membrane protein
MMKRRGGYSVVIALLLVIVGASVFPRSAFASACVDSTKYGAVQLFVPPLQKTGDYQLWVRLQSPTNNAKVRIELNNSECFEVGSTLLKPNTWEWIPYYEKNQLKTTKLTYKEGNIIKIIGVQSAVKVDKVLFTDPSCAPESFGNNCASSYQPAIIKSDDVRQISPPSNDALSGTVVVSSTPFAQEKNLTLVTYSANSKTIQKSTTAKQFDTTLLANGKYTLLIETQLRDGTVIKESTIISVDNPETVLSPLLRWLRLQKSSVIIISASVLVLAILLICLSVIRSNHLKRRERRFHGF